LQGKEEKEEMKRKRNLTIYIKTLCFLLISLVILFPVLYSFTNSFMGQEEITEAYSGILSVGADVGFHMFPEHFTLEAYGNVMLDTPEYWMKFWKSLGMAGIIAIGQLLIGGMCGMAFAKYHFPGWELFFFLIVIFLLLPVQVSLFPNFLILSWLKLTGTWWALILPGIFSPFGMFLMTLIFQNVSTELLEAARLDGAGTLRIFASILLPVAKPGAISLLILVFVDNWNMVEQPMVLLQYPWQYPLSVFLASVNTENFALQFVCGILSLVPVTLLFLFFHEELAEGISVSLSR
jgi:multiple sugar transport system permease protein